MSAALKDALNNCVINFDRRVNVTDLLQKYGLSYERVHKTLEEHLRQQESKGIKYVKRFLVQGKENENNEVYTVVQGETALPECLQRLQQPHAMLYSVEVEGGAKSPAYAFKPVERPAITLQSLKVRVTTMKFKPAPMTNGNTTSSAAEKDQKPLTKKQPSGMNMFAKQIATSSSTSKANASEQSTPSEKQSSPVKKPSPDSKKPSPVDSKSKKSAPAGTKGINNFFGAAAKSVPKKQEVIEVPHSSSPQKQPGSLKKQTDNTKSEKGEEPSTSKKVSPPKSDAQVKTNTSVQLFAEDTSDSSDEEKNLMERRSILDHEDAEPSVTMSGKRNRIVDSEEEDSEEPPQKLEKVESNSDTEIINIEEEKEDNAQPKSETFLDEEGFVITIKPKKTNASKRSSKKSTKARSPRKTPSKTQASKSVTAAAATKTKQVNIMNFFGKK